MVLREGSRDDRTELTVGQITETATQVMLSVGRVSANAGKAGGPRIRIASRDTDAIAEAEIALQTCHRQVDRHAIAAGDAKLVFGVGFLFTDDIKNLAKEFPQLDGILTATIVP